MEEIFTLEQDNSGDYHKLVRDGKDQFCRFSMSTILVPGKLGGAVPVPATINCDSSCPLFERETEKLVKLHCGAGNRRISITTVPKKQAKLLHSLTHDRNGQP